MPLELSLLPGGHQDPNKRGGVVDMRHVNEQCVEHAYPVPRIEDTLAQQGARESHSALDLKDAFHQIPLAEGSRYITCTATPRGIFQ